ncbi:MAG: hypothetical protein ACREQN_18230 [Candidatus Binataceae bacterium]
MKKLAIAGLALLLSVGLAGMAAAAETTATGTLEDGFCYTTMGAKGASHKKCAMECAQKGIPVALVEEGGRQIVLLPSQDKQPLPDSVISKMEEKVTITGDEYTKGGVTYMTVKSVK